MTELDSRAPAHTPLRLDPTGCVLLAVGGIAFFVSGPMHPSGTDEGDKTQQLHSMLVEPLWYPAHALGVLGFASVAAGLVLIGRQAEMRYRLGRLLGASEAIAVVGVVGAVIHLFAGTQASEIEDGSTTFLVAAFMGVETLVNPLWGLMICALAVRGGLTHTLGNRVVLPLGVLGGLAFALASATIAYVDTFDALFPVAGLIGVWLVAVGVIGLARRDSAPV